LGLIAFVMVAKQKTKAGEFYAADSASQHSKGEEIFFNLKL